MKNTKFLHLSVLAGAILVSIGGLTACGKGADQLYLEAKTAQIEVNSRGGNLKEVEDIYLDAANEGSVEAASFLTKYYYDIGEYEKSLHWGIVIKDKFPSEFCYYQGIMSLYGKGLKQDTTRGIDYLAKALEYKNKNAAYELGHHYELRNEYDSAVEFYGFAIKAGDLRARLPLAKLYLNNLSSTSDFAEAFRLVKLEANNEKNYEAKLLLAKCYIEGLGTSENLNLAESLLQSLQDKVDNNLISMLNAELKLYKGTIQSEQEGVTLLRKLSNEKQDADAAFLLYNIYTNGLYGQAKNDKEALYFIRISQKSGKPEAYLALAQMYLNGIAVEQNSTECFNLVSQVLEISPNYLEAIFWLGKMYAEGIGVVRNDDLGFEYISKAAARGHREAQYLKATMINSGRAKSTNEQEAIETFHKFANEGDAKSAYNYGMILYEGIGVPKNIKMAIKYLKQSVEGGVLDGVFTLAEAYDRTGDINNSIYWYKTLTMDSNPFQAESCARLGEIFSDLNQINESIRYYRQAYSLGLAVAGANLGREYFILGDYKGAAQIFENISNVNSLAQTFLGIMYEKGLAFEASEIKALEWYDKAISNGNIDAMYLKGVLLLRGKDIPEHLVETAEPLLIKAACANNEEAALFLGHKLMPSKGSLDRSAGWLTYALRKNGSSRAAGLLSKMSYNEEQLNRFYNDAVDSCRYQE